MRTATGPARSRTGRNARRDRAVNRPQRTAGRVSMGISLDTRPAIVYRESMYTCSL